MRAITAQRTQLPQTIQSTAAISIHCTTVSSLMRGVGVLGTGGSLEFFLSSLDGESWRACAVWETVEGTPVAPCEPPAASSKASALPVASRSPPWFGAAAAWVDETSPFMPRGPSPSVSRSETPTVAVLREPIAPTPPAPTPDAAVAVDVAPPTPPTPATPAPPATPPAAVRETESPAPAPKPAAPGALPYSPPPTEAVVDP